MSSRSSALAFLAFVSSTFAIPQHYAPAAPIRPTGLPSGGAPYPAGNSTGIWGTASGAYPPTGYPTGPVPSGPIGGASSPVAVASSYGTPAGYSPPAGSPSAAAVESACVSEVTSTVTNKVTVTVTAGYSPAGAESTEHPQTTVVSQVTVSPIPASSSPAGYSIASSAPAVSSPEATSSPVYIDSFSTPAYSSLASSSTASSAASTPSSAGSSSGTSGKRGAAYNDVSLVSAFANSAISWAYDWSYYGASDVPSGIEYVPMMWGNVDWAIADFTSTVTDSIASGSVSHILGFNEPDIPSQANMGVSDAVALWAEYMEPFAGKASLGSPAVSNAAAPGGLTYLQSFVDSCTDCTIDFINIHWYGDATNIEDFKRHVNEAISTFPGKDIWVTEFAPNDGTGSEEQLQSFLAEAMKFLDETPEVKRYAYFMVSDGRLCSGSGLSALGEAYAA